MYSTENFKFVGARVKIPPLKQSSISNATVTIIINKGIVIVV